MRRATLAVLAVGVLGSVVGGVIYLQGINRWFVVYLQFGIVHLVVGGTAYYERTRYALSPPRLLLVLLVPGMISGALVSALLATGTPLYDVYPSADSTGLVVVWVAAAVLVPLQYALGRPISDQYRWAVAGAGALIVAAPVVYYAVTVPPTLFGDELGPLSLVIGLGFWMSVPVYTVGRTVSLDADRRTHVVSPAIALATFAALTLLATAVLAGPVVPRDFGSVLLATLVYGPVVYVGVRGLTKIPGLSPS